MKRTAVKKVYWQVGDKVRCVTRSMFDDGFLQEGQEYTVIAVEYNRAHETDPSSQADMVLLQERPHFKYLAEHFEKVAL